jgi:hypothetical protein
MNHKTLFRALKNRGRVTLSYKKNEEIIYTIVLAYKSNSFSLYSYYDDGDFLADDYYKDEYHVEKPDFDELIEIVKDKFPGAVESWKG